jgi:hypothetical protein
VNLPCTKGGSKEKYEEECRQIKEFMEKRQRELAKKLREMDRRTCGFALRASEDEYDLSSQ